jgi:hypothetical protein
MSTESYSYLIEKTLRLLTPTQVEQQLQLTSNYTAGSGTMTVDSTAAALAAIRPGSILANGLNLFYVTSVASNVISVTGGYQGSTDVSQAAGSTPASTIVVRPKFNRFDIAIAINDEIDSLSAPDKGLGQILNADITWVPVFMGYALPTGFDSATSYILELQAKLVSPERRFPLIRKGEYRVIRNQTDPAFPSGCGVIVYSAKQDPGQPMHVQWLAPFTRLVNLTDDALTVAGIPQTAQDIVPMGAALRLAPPREIQRNTTGAQPDPRKAAEVPPNAIQSSANALNAMYLRRIGEERSRIIRSFPQAER